MSALFLPPGGSAAEVDELAFLTADGSDVTGAVGNPNKPFATLQAAFNAGAGSFWCGPGNFGALNVGNTNRNLYFNGVDAVIGDITGTTDVQLYGLPGRNVLFGSITATGANGAAGGVDQDGAAGTVGPAITCYQCTLTGNVRSIGGNGGAIGTGTATSGGAGANGGLVTLDECQVEGEVTSTGGTGGAGGTHAGGPGGNGGDIHIIHFSRVYSNTRSQGGDGGAGDTNGGGGGNGGAVLVQCAQAGPVTEPKGSGGASGGTPGSDGADGTVTKLAAVIDGVFYAS